MFLFFRFLSHKKLFGIIEKGVRLAGLHTISTLEIRAIYPKHKTDIGIRKEHKRLSIDLFYATYYLKEVI